MERPSGKLMTPEALEALRRMQERSGPNNDSAPSQESIEQPIKVRKKLPLFDFEKGKNI